MKVIERFATSLEWRMNPLGKRLRDELVGATGEFVGTTMFLFIAFAGTHIANLPHASAEISIGDGATAAFVDTSNLFFIACSFGFGLAINAWIFFRVSGSVFNPAITLSLFLIGALSPLRSAIYLVAQLLGGISAAALVDVLLPGGVNFDTALAGGVNISQGLFLEMFMTGQLVFVVLMLGVEKQRSTYLAPLAVGLTLFMCELASVYYTGGSLNPARSFGPNVVMRSFPSYHWIYWAGPCLGSLLATALYVFLKAVGYEKVNGTADRDDCAAVVDHIASGAGNRVVNIDRASQATAVEELRNGFSTVDGYKRSGDLVTVTVRSIPGTPTREHDAMV